MKSIEIIVRGRVQGVGYRYFVKEEAQRLGIKGWVKNLSNGNVLVLAQGEDLNVDEFVECIKTKHCYARIDDMEISPAGEEDLEFFKIKF